MEKYSQESRKETGIPAPCGADPLQFFCESVPSFHSGVLRILLTILMYIWEPASFYSRASKCPRPVFIPASTGFWISVEICSSFFVRASKRPDPSFLTDSLLYCSFRGPGPAGAGTVFFAQGSRIVPESFFSACHVFSACAGCGGAWAPNPPQPLRNKAFP